MHYSQRDAFCGNSKDYRRQSNQHRKLEELNINGDVDITPEADVSNALKKPKKKGKKSHEYSKNNKKSKNNKTTRSENWWEHRNRKDEYIKASKRNKSHFEF
jgi:hypothetical protein